MKKGTLSYDEVTRYISETFEIQYVFSRDIQEIKENEEKAKSSIRQFWFRLAVRTSIDYIDALQVRLSKLAMEVIKLRGDEAKLLPKPKNSDIRYFFKKLTAALNSSFELDKDDKNLDEYYKARSIRARVTHPQKLADLKITSEEYLKAINVYGWFDNCMKQISGNSPIKPKKKGD